MYAVPASCTVLGMIFYHVAAFGCKTFKIDTVSGFGFIGYTSKFGYWSVDFGRGCVKSGGNVGGAFKFGRFVGVFGSLLIWAIVAAVVIASFYKYPKTKIPVFPVVGGCMGVISLFSFLLLVGLSEYSSFKLAGGGALAILSAFIWAGGAVSMFLCMNDREGVRTSSVPATTNDAVKPAHPDTQNDPETNATENADDTA
jgi:hypothetical protein